MVIDFDDFGCNRVISDQCQSHDCRDKLDALHYANPNFKVTLFAIPGEMTPELLHWCRSNSGWVELAVHGFYHSSNYECEKMTYEEFDAHMSELEFINEFFVRGFKAPGWQISDDIYRWLSDHGWWVADQEYNSMRKPIGLPAYVNNNNEFFVEGDKVDAWHGHTWDCCGNGIYETYEQLESLVKTTQEFKFVSEILA